MNSFKKPLLEFIFFGEENILATSCPQYNCSNPLGYGDLCTGTEGHEYCTTESGYDDPCPNDFL